MIAPYLPEEIKIATGVGSHTTQVLRIVDFVRRGGKVPASEDLQQLCVGGYLNYQRILEHSPSLEAPARRGLKQYLVIRSAFADLVPDVMRILSEADNAKHENFQRVSFMETMHNIHRRLVNLPPADHDAASYLRIAQAVARGRGAEYIDACSAMVDFTAVFAGGVAKEVLLDIEKYVRGLKVVRDVHADFFKHLSLNKDLLPFTPYVAAMVKATVAAPKSFVKPDGARVFSSSDLADLRAKKHGALKESNDMLLKAIGLGEALGVREDAAFDRLYGNLGVNLVMFVGEKMQTSRFTSKVEIAVHFYNELCQAFGEKVRIECPWVVIKPAAKLATGSRQLVESNARGVVTCEILATLGYVLDTRVTKRGEEMVHCITNLNASTLTATLWDGKVPVDVAFTDLADDWKAMAEVTQSRHKALCHAFGDVVFELAKSRMKLAIDAAFQQRKGDLQGIEIQTLPRKGVFAVAKIKAKELKLVPRSLAVALSPTKPTHPNHMGEVAKDPSKGAPLYGVIQPQFPSAESLKQGNPQLTPYWFVETTSDTSMVNLEYASMAVAVLTSCKDDDDKAVMHVPVLQNTKAIDIGDELFVFKPLQGKNRDDGDRPPPPPPKRKQGGRGRGKQ